MSTMSLPTQKRSRLASFSLNIIPVIALLLGLIFPAPFAQNGTAAAQSVNTPQPQGNLADPGQNPQSCKLLHECALRFNGQNQWVELHNFRGFDTPAFTLESRFDWAGGGSPVPADRGLLADGVPFITVGDSVGPALSSNIDLFFGIQASTGRLMVAFQGTPSLGVPGKDYVLLGNTPVAPRDWHYAAATYDGQTLRLYLDGTLDGELTLDSPVLPKLVNAHDVYLAAALPYDGKGLGFFKG